jgi:hypothetical protein
VNIEKAKAIKMSSDWEEVRKELDVWIDSSMKRMKDCAPDELVKLQAKIRAYEEVKNLPDAVIDREE